METSSNEKEIRIRFIHEFLIKGGGNFVKMLNYVNEKSQEAGIGEIKERMLREHLADLRKGNFTHLEVNHERDKNGHLFDIVFDKLIYTYKESSPLPSFGDLDEEERISLPFLLGILSPYASIPAVSKVLEDIKQRFKLDQLELSSAKAVVVHKPLLKEEKKVVELTIKILGHIKREECIEFDYLRVDTLAPKKNSNIRKVMPLQIRIYENIYYLTAVTIEKEAKLANYRIDKIDRLKVDVLCENDTDTIVHFNYKKYQKEYNLSKRFENSIGIWIHDKDDPIETVRICFWGWAASYVQSLPLHKSQKIKQEDIDHTNNTLIAEISIQLEPRAKGKNTAIERSKELSFLLGRFSGFYKLLT